ncbi:DUF202 domain-containing protein [Alicyclobacillus fastidiosus]|uniref:DUF202 domain-containing protein n=1 Tax=Alicyclobacillus fastidiosus TaxID=392011 RepID=A0ABY6ZF97_9BACL|nr:DUF202 domain-containing protein [Alicyclobacillus fastidiosus]WAH41522.1 DUF202 domain-containing protein [Alicyclobacillus fastidiosus]GMA63175.1 hypothetical protein GCM10025859_36150 [Alicyclobacillus fastidiosus]
MRDDNEAKYVQQHLANERTFLAWIRTAIAIMGVGFVTTSLHFELRGVASSKADVLIKAVGYASLVLGCLTFVSATLAYLRKRAGINRGEFRASSWIVMFLAVALILIAVIFGLYLYNAY